MCTSVLSTLTLMHNQFLELLIFQKKPETLLLYPLNSSLHPKPLTVTILLSISINLTSLGTSYK